MWLRRGYVAALLESSLSEPLPEPVAPTFVFTLNGAETAVSTDPKTSVLDVLRESLGVLTMKAGCAPQGLCGCCTALIDGKPRLTCTLPIKSLAGKSVVTLEGVDPVVRDALAAAFEAEGGTQCGYCTPGIALSASALLAPGEDGLRPTPADDAIHRALAPHLCRCTGYTGIVDSIKLAGACLRGESEIPPSIRPEAREQVLGERPFVDDLVRPDMVYAVLVWAPGAVGTVEVADADGVLVLTREVRHACEPFAAVYADTQAAAKARARGLVAPFTPGMPAEEDSRGPVVARPDRMGDGVQSTICVTVATSDPVYLEPEAVLAVPLESGRIRLYTASQRPAAELAELRGLGFDVESRVLPSGGSYGGKTSTIPAKAAVMIAMRTGRPVKLSLDLEEGMRLHPRRPGGTATAAVTGDALGRIGELTVEVDEDGGLDRRFGTLDLPYACGGLVEALRAAACAESAGAVRGATVLLGAFAVESAVDAYARGAGLDQLDVRLASADPLAGALLGALAAVWTGAPQARGVALASGGTGFGDVCIHAKVRADGVELTCNVPELGQGRDAALVRLVARESGLDPALFTVLWGDPEVTGADAWRPVEATAGVLGEGLREQAARFGGLIGVELSACGNEDAGSGHAAAIAILGPEGQLTEVHVAVPCGPNQDPLDIRRVAEGSAHMGVGVALSEEVATLADGLPETRFRMLGVLKSKVSPTIIGYAVPWQGVGLDGEDAEVDSADAALAATAAAIANAVSAFEGKPRDHLPMKDSAAARAAGVRQARPGQAL